MAQEHLDRLTAIDASFLHQEGPNSHMHVGGVACFEGPPPPFDELLDRCAGACTSSRATASGCSVPPAGTGRPLWVDDPTFNLEYHVRHTALPAARLRGPAPASSPGGSSPSSSTAPSRCGRCGWSRASPTAASR